jgi:hypothetical protein
MTHALSHAFLPLFGSREIVDPGDGKKKDGG